MTTNPLATLTLVDLKNAVALRERIDALRVELDRLLSVGPSLRRGGNRMQRRRLAARNTRVKSAWRGGQRGTNRRQLSRAARARLSAMAKARWAKAKARGRNRL